MNFWKTKESSLRFKNKHNFLILAFKDKKDNLDNCTAVKFCTKDKEWHQGWNAQLVHNAV